MSSNSHSDTFSSDNTSSDSRSLIEDDAALRQCCQTLMSKSVIALDTEFVRTDTYYPQLGLVQINDGERCYLIDPLAIEDKTPLQNVLSAPQIVKVLHSCSEDFEALHRFFGTLPAPLFDTQVAAAFLGHGLSMGYQRLVEALYKVQLSKAEVRSDWLKRPLHSRQLQYAAQDVAYLLPTYYQFKQSLQEQGKAQWFESYQQELYGRFFFNQDEYSYYQRVKQAWQLSSQQLLLLQQLAIWREQTARLRDMPRGRVVSDASLLALAAARSIKSAEDLLSVEGMNEAKVRRYGEKLLAIVRQRQVRQRQNNCADLYPPLLPAPLSPDKAKHYKRAKHCLDEFAEGMGMAKELVFSKKELELLIRSRSTDGFYHLPEMPTWRSQLMRDALKDCLSLADECNLAGNQ